MTELKRTSATGWAGFGLLVLAWTLVYATVWLPDHGIPGRADTCKSVLFAAGAITASISVTLAIGCGRRHSRWWYLLAVASVISALALLADLLVGG